MPSPVPEPVRRLALDPFGELPTPKDVELVHLDGATVGFKKWPTAQLVLFQGDGPTDLAATVEASRAAARERGKQTLAWWVPPSRDAFAPQLEALGIVNEDTPGFEAIENAMALVEPPPEGVAEGVEVGVVESWDDFIATTEVARQVFGMPEMPEDALRAAYDDYHADRKTGAGVYAALDGRIVASAYAAFGHAGINLFGGAVLPEARGRGVYRSLVTARWQMAVERGTPALTVQASKMARPILERVGFHFLAAARIFVDTVD